MSNTNNPAALLATLLSGLSTGAVNVVELEIDPSRPIEDQLGEIGEKLDAAHRAECPHCAAEYAMDQALAKGQEVGEQPKAPSRGVADEIREKVKAKQQYEITELAKKHDEERAALEKGLQAEGHVRATAFDKNLAAPYGKPEDKPTFREIGFMAFNKEDGSPIAKSFRVTREEVEMDIETFRSLPAVQMFAKFIPQLSSEIVIRPVYSKE